MVTNTLSPTTACGERPSNLILTSARAQIQTETGTPPSEPQEYPATLAQISTQDRIRGQNQRPGERETLSTETFDFGEVGRCTKFFFYFLHALCVVRLVISLSLVF